MQTVKYQCRLTFSTIVTETNSEHMYYFKLGIVL